MPHYNIVIVTPGTEVVASYVGSLVKTLAECQKRNLTFGFANGQSSLVHHARESAVGGKDAFNISPSNTPFGKDITYDTMVWIDSDISWEVEDFFKLVDTPYEVATGAYKILTGQTSIQVDERGLVSPEFLMDIKEPLRIQSCGFGFVAIKNGVFERLQRPWFVMLPAVVGELNGEQIIDNLGEDISWCIKVADAKIDIWFIPEVFVNHHKNIPLSFPKKT